MFAAVILLHSESSADCGHRCSLRVFHQLYTGAPLRGLTLELEALEEPSAKSMMHELLIISLRLLRGFLNTHLQLFSTFPLSSETKSHILGERRLSLHIGIGVRVESGLL